MSQILLKNAKCWSCSSYEKNAFFMKKNSKKILCIREICRTFAPEFESGVRFKGKRVILIAVNL